MDVKSIGIKGSPACYHVNHSMKTRYLVCASPRSGSNLLCNLLENTGVSGMVPLREFSTYELLNDVRAIDPAGIDWEKTDLEVFFRDLFDRYGSFKIIWYQLERLIESARGSTRYRGLSLGRLARLLPRDTEFILTSRRNRIQQAVSLFQARLTGNWKVVGNKPENDRELAREDFHPEALLRCLEEIEASDRAWREFFLAGGLQYLEIEYETMIRDCRASIVKVLDHLDLPCPEDLEIRTDLSIQRNKLSRYFEKRFRRYRRRQLLSRLLPPLTRKS